jgi:hypothetical protein
VVVIDVLKDLIAEIQSTAIPTKRYLFTDIRCVISASMNFFINKISNFRLIYGLFTVSFCLTLALT